jgi:hypothetical protein
MIRGHNLAANLNEDALDADAVSEVMEYDPSTFWRRNWEIAERLGDPTPPFKGLTHNNVPVYCSETGERATDQGVSCVCGCTEYLRLQKRMKRADAMKQRKAELAVAAFVAPKAWARK